MTTMKREYALHAVNPETGYRQVLGQPFESAAAAEAAKNRYNKYIGKRFEVVSRVVTDWEQVK